MFQTPSWGGHSLISFSPNGDTLFLEQGNSKATLHYFMCDIATATAASASHT
jgi:hypothetical protein